MPPLFRLVSALMGLDKMKAAYAHAIGNGYNFYSYGDASLSYRRCPWVGGWWVIDERPPAVSPLFKRPTQLSVSIA